MPLSAGDKLGPYTILAPIGSGGMGEIYRGRDTKLDREVAVKVLPAALARDPERLARFEREAKVLASLNHPNIAQIYGVQEAAGYQALVMELVPGQTLAARIKNGAIPLDESLRLSAQMVDALSAAHEKGITHRDLKPANIMITPDGVVKVLDFGLAAVAASTGGDAHAATNSPTFTMSPTSAGMIMGTAPYMSPEQARGNQADRRSDIFSFGVVLYEMLTGRQLFHGETVSDILASVLKDEPNLGGVPEKVRPLLKRCLEKDPKKRLQAIGDWDLLLGVGGAGFQPATEASASVPSRLGKIAWIAAGVLAVGLVVAGVGWYRATRPVDVQRTAARFTIPLPPGHEITTYPAITRDGKTIAYVTQQGIDASQLYLRDLNSFEARAVAGSTGAVQPFFSPDGKWVAFFAQGQLQKAEVTGGAPIRLAEAAYPFGGTWNEDNTIIYAVSISSGLLRIPARGGTPEALTKPDGAAMGYAHVFPQALPGGRTVLFTIWGQTQGNAVLSLDSHRWELVLPTKGFEQGIFDSLRGSTGRILVVDQSAGMMAAPFDAAHPARTSADTTVLSNVYWEVELESRGWLAISNNRTAVYAPGNPARTSLVWVDREGKSELLGKDEDLYRDVRLSPDGTKAVVRVGGNLWIHDLQRGTRSPLTLGNASNYRFLWSPDGTRIIFGSNRGGDWDIYSQPADGSRPAEVLLKRPYDQYPLSVSADGTLLYREVHPKTGSDLWTCRQRARRHLCG